MATSAARAGSICVAVGALVALSAPRDAFAHGAATEPMPAAAIPPSPTPEGSNAQRILAELEADRSADPKLTAEPVLHARQALDRARGARASGDTLHAHLLDALALEWAETARELRRAAALEARAMTASRKAHELSTQADRARTLLEDAQARRQRAAAELERMEAEARDKKAAQGEGAKAQAAKKDAKPSKKKGDKEDKPDAARASGVEPAVSGKKGAP